MTTTLQRNKLSLSRDTMMFCTKDMPSNRASMDVQRFKQCVKNHAAQHARRNLNSQDHGHSRTQHNHQNYQNNCSNLCGLQKNCCMASQRSLNLNSKSNAIPQSLSWDKAPIFYRKAVAQSDANYKWIGKLSLSNQKPIAYSSKVFVGGLPRSITEATLIDTFKPFGRIQIEWPGQTPIPFRGYVYIIFDSERQVESLLSNCTYDYDSTTGGSYYYKISSKRNKAVQVIPWAINDSNYYKSSQHKLDHIRTVFVGALHGMITATGLATIMNDLFGNVVYAGIDTDKHKYPIGSARVTFASEKSYNEAVNAGFIEVISFKFTKIIQVDPYIGDSPCSSCFVPQGLYFCREKTCFKYYCHTCWQWNHKNPAMNWHKPMSRGLKNSPLLGLSPSIGPSARSRYLL